MKSPLDIKIVSYLDVKVPFTKLKRRRWWIDSKQKGNGKHINHRQPRTIKGRRKHKMERKEMVKMWEARHYKARLEAMATLKMSVCVCVCVCPHLLCKIRLKSFTPKGGNSHKWLRHKSVFTSKCSTLLHI